MSKLVHIQVVDGDKEEIGKLTEFVNGVKKNHPEFDFLITNDRIELRDIRTLIQELYELYNKTKELQKK